MTVHESLKRLLDAIGMAARTQCASEAIFELGELYFMNSSCLSLLLRFINGALGSRPSEQYKIRFRSNPNLRWQRKSLDALRAYSHEIVVVE